MSNCQWAMLMDMIEDFGAALGGPPVEGAEAEEASQIVAGEAHAVGQGDLVYLLKFCQGRKCLHSH